MVRQLEVCFLASGETVAFLDADEFEEKPAQTLKQTLAAQIGVSRFRQRLLLEGASHEISDDVIFSPFRPSYSWYFWSFCHPMLSKMQR